VKRFAYFAYKEKREKQDISMSTKQPRRRKQRRMRRLSAVQIAKQDQAFHMRRAGASFSEIAEAMGFSDRGGAWRAVDAAQRRFLEGPANQVRDLELARLDAWLWGIEPQIAKGSLKAIDTALMIAARRARLLGLDRPTRRAGTTPDASAARTGTVIWLPATPEERPAHE
jgi:hypothetical protein